MSSSNILVLYGSQTGTAQDIAERLWRESRQFNFSGPVMCMDDYPIEKLIFEQIVVFVVSTTGQGEEPDNMKNFWKFLLRRNLPVNSLNNVKFAVLGLGDSSYVKFNFVAKRLTRRLSHLGGVPLIETGYADDQHDLGVDAVVDKWVDELWAKLSVLLHFTKIKLSNKFEPRWDINTVPEGDIAPDQETNINSSKPQYSQRTPCKLQIINNTRLTPLDHFQDVRLIKLKIPGDLTYRPGDVLMTVPQNSDENVKQLFNIINAGRSKADQICPSSLVRVTQKDEGLPVPYDLIHPIRLEDCAKKYWDLNAIPRRSAFSTLSQVTCNNVESEKLQELAAAEGLEDLYNYCNRPRRTILEVLADFPLTSRQLNLDTLFDVLQPIKPRAFSIASSIMAHPGEVHVLLAVVKYKTKLFTARQGLCSTYLADMPNDSHIFGWIRPGSFRFPFPGNSVIMVGPGTGVAPFRSFIQEANATGCANHEDLLLLFGCRNEYSDFFFSKEWEKLIDDGCLRLITAFSRDQPDKIYVQHRIKQHGEEVWRRLSRNGTVLIAGSSKNMPTSVREAFIEVAQTHGRLTLEDSIVFVENLERSGRFQTETWG